MRSTSAGMNVRRMSDVEKQAFEVTFAHPSRLHVQTPEGTRADSGVCKNGRKKKNWKNTTQSVSSNYLFLFFKKPLYLSHRSSFLKPSIISWNDFPSPRSISSSTSSIRALSSSIV